MSARIGILCHMLTRKDPNCTLLVWGDFKNGKLGRVPTAIRFGIENDARCLVFAAGKSHESAIPNSMHAYRYTLEHIHELAYVLEMKKEELKKWLIAKVITDPRPTTTLAEVEVAGKIFLGQLVTQPVQVTSPDHIFRAHKFGVDIWGREEYKGLRRPWAIPAETEAPGQEPGKVLVIEPTFPKYAAVKAVLEAK